MRQASVWFTPLCGWRAAREPAAGSHAEEGRSAVRPRGSLPGRDPRAQAASVHGAAADAFALLSPVDGEQGRRGERRAARKAREPAARGMEGSAPGRGRPTNDREGSLFRRPECERGGPAGGTHRAPLGADGGRHGASLGPSFRPTGPPRCSR